jgi:Putative glycosyl/glycerophosphate transferases involved in teichoic acid biosynthesis TagF/TagB/EpsJ/RodC
MDENEEAYLHKKIYYIISKDSPDHYKVDPYKKNVINFMSIRHMIYTQAADLIVSSDSRYHTYAMQCRHSIFNRYLRKKKFVFLQHGVIALKRVDAFYSKGMRGGCDLFVVSTNQEKQTIVDNFGYEPDEVINTGLPRWDVLEDTSNGNREILIMPTWRSWLDSVPDKDFEESDYFRHYMALLNSSHFSQLLEKYDLQVNFYLHAKFQEYSDNFKAVSDRIHLISFGEVAVNEMLMRCRMLITDYSSVCWDVLYQDKPTLFYQFDLDKYNEAHGSYIDMKTELFGDRAETEEQLMELLKETVLNDFRLKPEYELKRHEYLQFKDNQHSRHICEEIKEKL